MRTGVRAATRMMGLLLLTAALAASCGGAPSPAPGASAAPATPGADEVDRLRALGYVGFTPRGAQGSGVVRREPGSHPGYNLYTNRDLCSAVLMDERGAIENYWTTSPCGRWSNADMLASGDLLVVGAEPARSRDPDDVDTQRYLMKLGWDGRTAWKRPIAAHHDVEVTPSGELLTLVAVNRTIPEFDPVRPLRDSQIARLSAAGELIETVSLYDLFAAAPGLVKLQRVKGSPKREVDLFHANSVEWLRPLPGGGPDPLDGPSRVLVSLRHQDAAVVVDWKARRLVWAWGQGEVSGPHDATRLENGNLLFFDNGLSRGWSRVVEVDPASRRIVWEYRAPRPADFYTVSRGSSQRLPNGNTLIAQSDSGRAFEVTPEGRIVWDFWNPFGNEKGERATIVRIKRYERPLIADLVRRLGAGRRQATATVTAGSPASAASPSAPR